MNRLPLYRLLASLLICSALGGQAFGQSLFDQRQLLYSTNSTPTRGLNWAPQPPQTLNLPPGAQPNQFRGGIVYGGVTKQGRKFSTNDSQLSGSFAANADVIKWPSSRNGGVIVSILRAAVGAPYISHGHDYLFGQEMSPPVTDMNGAKLADQANYWHAEPVYIQSFLTTNATVVSTNYVLDTSPDHAGADYYWSPHKQAAYATKSGVARVTWRTENPVGQTLPSGGIDLVTHVRVGPFYYALTNTTVIVSGIPFTTPRRIYWTKGDYEKTGKPVLVPAGVKSINFLYNNAIPEFVPESEVVVGGNIRASTPGSNNGNLGGFTRTIQVEAGFITAYNREGRIFVELLGDATGENTKRQLGVEIVDVYRDAVPQDVTIQLGERVTAFPNNVPDDAGLEAAPITQLGQTFAYEQNASSNGEQAYYATHITHQLSDYQVYWMEEGVGGLRWPFRFARYNFVWPTDAAKFTHYVRTQVPDEAAASLTAVRLPPENAPALEEQDPSNINVPRATLTDDDRFYTFLDATQPTLRALIRYNVGDHVAFDRVFSWLDSSLKDGTLDGTLAGNLDQFPAFLEARARGVNGPWTLTAGRAGAGAAGAINSWAVVVESRNRAGATVVTEFAGPKLNITTSGFTSQICAVAGITNVVTDVRLKINGLTHPKPNELTLTLTHGANSADMMANVGGSSSVTNVNLVFSDAAANPIAASLSSGTYRPGEPLGSLLLPAPISPWPDDTIAPRVYAATAVVGSRIEPPDGELGSGGFNYLAGYINQSVGASFSASAYIDPFARGFAVANQAAIIPVNAIPGQNSLEVWWFRKNADTPLRDPDFGFKSAYWPAVIGRYTLAWPDDSDPNNPEIVLAGNRGSGPLDSFQAAGSLYVQNSKSAPGYNPNEEHAVLIGGRAWALRDDLNVTSGSNFSSQPYVLLEYADGDGRPKMTAFHVVREKGIDTFKYQVNAGTILQAPMPLPLLAKPTPPNPPGTLPKSINAEIQRVALKASTVGSADASGFNPYTLTLDGQVPPFAPYEKIYVRRADGAQWRWMLTTGINADAKSVSGFLTSIEPTPLLSWTGAPASQTTRRRFVASFPNGIAVGSVRNAIVANSNAKRHWGVIVTAVDPQFVEVDFGAAPDDDAAAANVLVFSPISQGDYSTYRLSYSTRPESIDDSDVADFYTSVTFQDRKGDLWAYRGPHDDRDSAKFAMQFYYKTLPGFWFPTDASGKVLGTSTSLANQPDVGVITPYLRPLNNAGDGYLGDAIFGNSTGAQVGDKNPLAVVYQARWPDNAPVMLMAETLTVPKRGLPAVRGQTSMEVLYQQSVYEDASMPSVVLHDPTAAKKFPLFNTNPDGSADGGLNQLPSSIQTSVYRGKTYFPRLAPHLVERFYFDPNDSKNGSLIFNGEFKNETLGESYLLLNVLSSNDAAALKALCASDDPQKTDWDKAIDGGTGTARLGLELETFYPNPAKPGTFTNTLTIDGVTERQAVRFNAGDLAEVKHSDTAVDSYALTATGPGIGYVTLISGQGVAFTPTAEPVSMKIVRVADTLYRGEVKVVLSSNPLAEKVTMQQIVDLAGKVDNFDFEWWIGSPVDGAPPAVYGNTPVNLVSGGTWNHLPYPLPGEGGATAGTVGAMQGSSRVGLNASTVVVPVNSLPFNSVTSTGGRLMFVIADATTQLAVNNQLSVRTTAGVEIPVKVASLTVDGNPATTKISVDADGGAPLPAANTVLQLSERVQSFQPQSVLFQDFTVPTDNAYSQYYLSLDIDDALGAVVYVDGTPVAMANWVQDSPTTTAPGGFNPAPLSKVYSLGPQVFAGGLRAGGNATHRLAVELYSGAIPGAALHFNLQLDAYQSVDKVEAPGSQWIKLSADKFPDKVRTILGENADVRALSDNYVIMRYKAKADAPFPAASKNWSQWTDPALAEGWIKRVLAGINPFNQRATDLFNNTVNTDANILTSAGKRWEGDVALNLDSINNFGLIEIYETVLRRGKDLSINAGIGFDPANDALLLAAGYLSDLYMMVGNEARSDAENPTIGIGTKDSTYGDIATSLFAFKGQVPSLLEEELALLRGRDDFLQPGVRVAPVYNRLVWNYTRGIDSGEVIYALNYNILDQNNDGKVDADDAAELFPQGHGDAYGHYLTALKGYYSLLIDRNFTWVPRIEAVNILGKPIAVDYQDERKFASAAAAVARTGKEVFDLTWRRDFQPGSDAGWTSMSAVRDNTSMSPPTHRTWGADHWAARTGQGAYINWAMGNSILPSVDPNPAHEGIQKVDRTTVPELKELANTEAELQTAMDNAEGHLTPLGLASGSLAFDINPNQVVGSDPKPHFEQIYERALGALNNAVVSFDDAKDVTRLMRSEQDSLADLQASILHQEQAYTNALIELYGTPYPDDVGPGKTYKQGYAGPDLVHYTYVETETIEAPGVYTPNEPDYVAKIDIQQLPASWSYPSNLPRTTVSTNGPVDGSSDDLVIVNANSDKYQETDPTTGKPLYYIAYPFGSHGFFDKPAAWTSSRKSPGKIQQAISEVIQAHDRMYYALAAQCESDKQDLDKAVQVFQDLVATQKAIAADTLQANGYDKNIVEAQAGYDKLVSDLGPVNEAFAVAQDVLTTSSENTIIGLANTVPLKFLAGIGVGIIGIERVAAASSVATHFNTLQATLKENLDNLRPIEGDMEGVQNLHDLKQAIFDLGNELKAVQGDFQVINEKLRILDDAKRKYASLVAEGERLLQEREAFRQRSAAIIQGFRTRDAAFRIFRNEKLERYKSLFDLSARYAYLAANAYDYETGLLNTPEGKSFVSRIVNSRALGVVKNGAPQFAGSDLGDPGLSSALAAMKADWDVLKGRLGFNNPTAYGTTFSLRTEKERIVPTDDGANAWKDVLLNAKKANILEDADVRRFCMQIDPGNGLPQPGLVIEFSTTIADGVNFFGQQQLGWDHYFDSSSFATKIFAAGVAFEGYIGMDNPAANSGAVASGGGTSTPDPSLAFLDPNALGATPGIYLIPVGIDSMRSPALGDVGTVRTWTVDDVTIPLPFNIGNSDFSTKAQYQTSDSLSEPLFAIRKHASFRPVSTTAAFSSGIYGNDGSLQRSQFTNTRLIGRSVWNSKWKLVIPGSKLLNDPDEGLRRFINTVTDIKLHLVTYSYSGN